MKTSAQILRSNPLKWLAAASMCFAFAACSDDEPPNDTVTPPEQLDCEEGETKNLACGDDDAGTQAQICEDGEWTNDGACDEPEEGDPACEEDATREASCGENDDGTQQQVCIDGEWTDDGDCEEPVGGEPACEDGATREEICGEDDDGTQQQVCEDGEWIDDGDCELIDESCEDDETRIGTCGPHDNGEQAQICVDGEWVADGDCEAPESCALEDADSPKCKAGVVEGATVQLPSTGFWHSDVEDAEAPPALDYIREEQFALTDAFGREVAFESEEDADGNVSLTWTHIEDEDGAKYAILRGEYFFQIIDEDEVLAQGWLNLRSHSEHERVFVFKGFSLDVDDVDGSTRDVTLVDAREDLVEPLHIEEGENSVRYDYIVPSNTHYRYDIPAVSDANVLGEHRNVYSPTDPQRYVHIETIDAVVVPYDVSAGAEFGAWVKRNSIHFSRFDAYTVLHDQDASTSDYDRYLVYAKAGEQFSIHAALEGDFTKEVLVQSVSETPEAPVVIDVLPAKPTEVGSNDFMEADLYTSAPHSGVISLFTEATGSQSFTMDIMRVWQAMEGMVANFFFEPEFQLTLHGDDNAAIESSNTPGRDRYRIDALDEGVSVLTIGYKPLRLHQGLEPAVFNAISPENTVALVIQVGETNDDNIDLNIDSTEYDTWYFDAGQSNHAPLTFEPTADADFEDICVHDPLHDATWGDAWNCFEADGDAYTVELKNGRNILRARTENSTVYRVIMGKALDITIENKDSPGEALSSGDTAVITFDGLRTPVQKIAGIYNPAFGAVYLHYLLVDETIVGPGSQFFISTTGSVLELEFEESGEFILEDGRIHSNHFGDGLDSHKHIAVEGHGPNLDADTITERDYFSYLPNVTIEVN